MCGFFWRLQEGKESNPPLLDNLRRPSSFHLVQSQLPCFTALHKRRLELEDLQHFCSLKEKKKLCPGSSCTLSEDPASNSRDWTVSNLRNSKPWRESTDQVRHEPTALQMFIPQKNQSCRIFSSLGLIFGGAASIPSGLSSSLWIQDEHNSNFWTHTGDFPCFLCSPKRQFCSWLPLFSEERVFLLLAYFFPPTSCRRSGWGKDNEMFHTCFTFQPLGDSVGQCPGVTQPRPSHPADVSCNAELLGRVCFGGWREDDTRESQSLSVKSQILPRWRLFWLNGLASHGPSSRTAWMDSRRNEAPFCSTPPSHLLGSKLRTLENFLRCLLTSSMNTFSVISNLSCSAKFELEWLTKRGNLGFESVMQVF